VCAQAPCRALRSIKRKPLKGCDDPKTVNDRKTLRREGKGREGSEWVTLFVCMEVCLAPLLFLPLALFLIQKNEKFILPCKCPFRRAGLFGVTGWKRKRTPRGAKGMGKRGRVHLNVIQKEPVQAGLVVPFFLSLHFDRSGSPFDSFGFFLSNLCRFVNFVSSLPCCFHAEGVSAAPGRPCLSVCLSVPCLSYPCVRPPLFFFFFLKRAAAIKCRKVRN